MLRAVVAARAPGAPVIDLSHEVAPFDVRAGALMLARCAPALGPGVVVAVVDPTVGTSRRPVALAVASGAGPRHLVGPDNGLLGFAAEALGGVRAAVTLAPEPGAARTFDGRDLFAPAGARLWSGARLADLGPAVDPGSLVRLAVPAVHHRAGALEAEVTWVDRFGNVQLAAGPDDAAAAGLSGTFTAVGGGGPQAGRRVGAFAELAHGQLGLLVDANGRLALVCDRRPAATVLAVRDRDLVTLRPTTGPGGVG